MFSHRLSVLTVAFWTLLHPGQGIAETLCKPQIAVNSVKFSEPINLKRYWTATVNVEASSCAASSGLFALGFVRLSETAPDLEFTEPFVWRLGQTMVRVEFWWDEAVDRYWVADVATCPCGPSELRWPPGFAILLPAGIQQTPRQAKTLSSSKFCYRPTALEPIWG